MDRQPVVSSNISEIGWDEETGTLEVLFTTGSVYQYDGVPVTTYQSLLHAPSIGSYFARNIRPLYTGRLVS